MKSAVGLAIVIAVVLRASAAKAGWQQGEFQSGGKPVSEHHCAPGTPGPHPAVVLLYGSSGYFSVENQYEDMCLDLAENGYFVESMEYLSQPGTSTELSGEIANLPTFDREIRSGLDALAKNPAVDPRRLALVGFSLGAYLALTVGAEEHQRVAAIVEYYGGLLPQFEPLAEDLPPTLILHGTGDQIVPVSSAHRIDELMSQSSRPHEIHVYPTLTHGFNFANGYNRGDWWDRTLAFLDKYLKPGS